MPDTTPAWTPQDAETLKALLDRYLESHAGEVELTRRDPALARADLKGRHGVAARPEWDVRLLRSLDGCFSIRLMPYDSRLSRRIDEVRQIMGRGTRELRLELLITKMRLQGTYSRIPSSLAAVKKRLSSEMQAG